MNDFLIEENIISDLTVADIRNEIKEYIDQELKIA